MLARTTLVFLLAGALAHAQPGSGSGSGSGSDAPSSADPQAQAVFDRGEKAWMEAVGLTVTVTSELSVPVAKEMDGSRITGTFHAASGRAALRLEGKLGGSASGLWYVLNGEQSGRAEWSNGAAEPPLDPRPVDAKRAEHVRRVAFRGSMFLVGREHLDPERFAVSGFQLAPSEADDGREMHRILYDLRIEDQSEAGHIELWLDAEGLPRRRILKVANHPGGPIVTLTETYEVTVGEVPAERFALPEVRTTPPAKPVDPPSK